MAWHACIPHMHVCMIPVVHVTMVIASPVTGISMVVVLGSVWISYHGEIIVV